jgi:hypothetical protein
MLKSEVAVATLPERAPAKRDAYAAIDSAWKTQFNAMAKRSCQGQSA